MPPQVEREYRVRFFSWESHWVQFLLAPLITAVLVTAASLAVQARLDDDRSERESRRDNLRFVRERSGVEYSYRPFKEIDLKGQNISGLNIQGADFAQADLRDANLLGTNLGMTPDGVKSILIKANLQKAYLYETNLQQADLTYADLRGADSIGANFQGAVMVGVDFRNSLFDTANFMDASLVGSDFSGSWMRESDFTAADLTAVNMENTYLAMAILNTDFSEIGSLAGSELAAADLSQASGLPKDIKEKVCFDERTKWPEELSQIEPMMPSPKVCKEVEKWASGVPYYRRH